MACDTNNEVSNAYICTVQQYSYPQEIPPEYNGEEKCDVTLPWKHYFWMTDKTDDDGDVTENGKK